MKGWHENGEQKKWREVEEQEQRRLVMPCNDGRDARRPVGREKQKPDEREREKGKEVITVLYLLAEIEPPQLVATESKDIPATVGAVSLGLSLAILMLFTYGNKTIYPVSFSPQF